MSTSIPIQPAGTEVPASHVWGKAQQVVIAAHGSRSLPVGTSSVESSATSPEFDRTAYRKCGHDRHGSHVVYLSPRISGGPPLLHRRDLAQSLPATASTRSLRREGAGPSSERQIRHTDGEVDRYCVSEFRHRQKSFQQEYLHPCWVSPCSETLILPRRPPSFAHSQHEMKNSLKSKARFVRMHSRGNATSVLVAEQRRDGAKTDGFEGESIFG